MRPALRSKYRVNARRLALAQAIHRRKGSLLLANDPSCSKADQAAAWESVKLELVGLGFTEFAPKNSLDIRNADWYQVRRFVINKRRREMASGAVGEPAPELDRVVLEVLGMQEIARSAQAAQALLEKEDLEDSKSEQSDTEAAEQPETPVLDQSQEGSVESEALNNSDIFRTFVGEPNEYAAHVSYENLTDQEYISELRRYRLDRERHRTQTEIIKKEIEAEKLAQEKIRTKILEIEYAKLTQ